MGEIMSIIIENTALVVELIGVFIIIVSIAKVIYNFAKVGFNVGRLDKTSHLNRGLAFALEILLASEILKTLIAKDLRNLLELGALITIRIIMSVLIHWELTINEKHAKAKLKED